jgi:hypothetical protein
VVLWKPFSRKMLFAASRINWRISSFSRCLRTGLVIFSFEGTK